MDQMYRLENVIAQRWSADRPMVWFEGEWWNSGRVFELVDKNVEQLKAAGFGAGDRIVALLPTSPAFLALCLAAWKLHGTVATLNVTAGLPAVAAQIKHSMPSAIVADPALKAHAAAFQGLPVPVVFLEPASSLPEFTARPNVKTSEDMSMLFFTSGTTGTPKSVPITHKNIITCLQQTLKLVLPDVASQTMFNVLPNFHTMGCIMCSFMPMLAGIRQAVMGSFLPVQKTIQAIDASESTILVCVPSMLHFLCAAAAKTGWKPKCVKYVVSGGDRLVNALRARVKQLLGAETIIEGYGLTECSPILAAQPHWGAPDGSVGPLLEHIQYKLCDVETGEDVTASREGVLWVKGPNVITEYFNAPEINAEKFKDGWFNTGDMVRIDEKGNVFIQERVSDLIIVGGHNVYPQEVEAVLNANPHVQESAAVGVEQSATGQIVRAFVIMKEGAEASAGELIKWCKERLPNYGVPRSIQMVTELPRNALGKVLRRKLREDQKKD